MKKNCTDTTDFIRQELVNSQAIREVNQRKGNWILLVTGKILSSNPSMS